MSLSTLIKRGLDTPVDFAFIKRVVGSKPDIRMVDHETGLKNKPSLADVFKGRQAVAILLHIMQGKTPVGHWVLLLKARKGIKISFFDSLGLGLYKLYALTHEEPKLLHALKGHKWENSTVQLQRFGDHFRECGAFVSIRAAEQPCFCEAYKVLQQNQARRNGSSSRSPTLLGGRKT